jgi:hypothetical protein
MTCQPSHASLDRQQIKETRDKIDTRKKNCLSIMASGAADWVTPNDYRLCKQGYSILMIYIFIGI